MVFKYTLTNNKQDYFRPDQHPAQIEKIKRMLAETMAKLDELEKQLKSGRAVSRPDYQEVYTEATVSLLSCIDLVDKLKGEPD